MSGFQFHDLEVSVNLCGRDYSFALDAVKRDRVAALGQQFKAENDAIPGRASIARLTELVDLILGEGKTAEVFGERPVNASDLADLVFYLADAITKAEEKRSRSVMNRAQRRAVKVQESKSP